MGKTVIRRALPRLASCAALTAFFAALPAHAQTASARFAKSEAILGGSSALEAILATQKVIAGPVRAPLVQPASYGPARNAVAAELPRPLISPAVLSGRPDIFGSVALRVGRTPLTARWRRVESAAISGAPARFAQGLADLDPIARLEAVNRYVNRRVTFTEDRAQHGRADVWSAAADTFARKRGDCEDYAIAKMQMLRRAGFEDRDLYLAIVKDLVTRADHAVLVVRADDRMIVLDNGTEELLDSEALRDYRPILTFNRVSAWTHGYRVRDAGVNIASNEPEQRQALAPSAETQRSRSASLLALSTGFNK
ncbi:transglutaminase-like cysteine peptidase [Sphingomonas lutea]|uniref:Transglutaminase-like cysteine peptidase n=1 Tax=Sphingomonas lutea TaxID=1045317 RepID=A0A7G9SI23_9SPHN|nr:transglutaminase-like cysteine peptidase [Sphingomonas lutea]QNN67498.1 transglutaminase-like cysteine peptidase [Sphingomonas lutea]